ncbi:MAG: GNAT family N-acetyltransferase [Clostridia bacterium]|nr:GNAT family N-acetyltransferase [Clostridia bacterium]
MDGEKIVGFIGLAKELVEGYMILDVIQVTEAFRGQGIGRKLFRKGVEEARKAGAKGLYISACPSEETIGFYRAMGSELADPPIREFAEEEPFDLQMVCDVRK